MFCTPDLCGVHKEKSSDEPQSEVEHQCSKSLPTWQHVNTEHIAILIRMVLLHYEQSVY